MRPPIDTLSEKNICPAAACHTCNTAHTVAAFLYCSRIFNVKFIFRKTDRRVSCKILRRRTFPDMGKGNSWNIDTSFLALLVSRIVDTEGDSLDVKRSKLEAGCWVHSRPGPFGLLYGAGNFYKIWFACWKSETQHSEWRQKKYMHDYV